MKSKIIAVCICLIIIPTFCFSKEVSFETAKQVGQNYLKHYQTNYGKWANYDSPEIMESEIINYNNIPIAYNFVVYPSGHLLIAFWDEFSPVLLYSTTSNFDSKKINKPNSVESWIIPEIYKIYKLISASRQKFERASSYKESKVAKAWQWLNLVNTRFSSETSSLRFTSSGPLLLTAWSQDEPYNNKTPADSSCTHTLTGCVSTAWSQIMKYWNWPDKGVGSVSYKWNGQTLSSNFDHIYNWANMPNELSTSSSSAQINAVSTLMYDVGIASKMDYSCESSGSYKWAKDILPKYFKYKNTAKIYDRESGDYTSPQWLSIIKTEIDSKRPITFSIYDENEGGHEAVIDGYQSDITDKVHINFGWGGYSDGFYDITNNFTAAEEKWLGSTQQINIGIEPDKALTTTTTTIITTTTTTTTTIFGNFLTGKNTTEIKNISKTTTNSQFISAGSITNGGDTMKVDVCFPDFGKSVDLYVAITNPQGNVVFFSSESPNWRSSAWPWKYHVSGKQCGVVLSEFPTLFIPKGKYIFHTIVMPAYSSFYDIVKTGPYDYRYFTINVW